ncbi:division plane positioning ATPase MipZ [Candidatus Trichorickettsia mobilis]
MQDRNMSRIFVIGNEKGGAGKTTCAMHLISALLDQGYKVASIDTDLRQLSLTNYIKNRELYNQKNPDKLVPQPCHFYLTTKGENDEDANLLLFEQKLCDARNLAEYIVIDTPGYHSLLSKLAHSYADTIITPINDSFMDLDVMAKINPDDLSIISPSIYSQMVWEQKMQRAARDQSSIEWIVMRNRLSQIDAVNKRNVGYVLEKLAKRISFKIAPGFSERVVFRELFLYGLTLLDLTTANLGKPLALSHVAARQELRDFLTCLGI